MGVTPWAFVKTVRRQPPISRLSRLDLLAVLIVSLWRESLGNEANTKESTGERRKERES